MRLYRDANGLPPKNRIQKNENIIKISVHSAKPNLSEYESMTKEKLIQELVKSRIRKARLKKGYEVKSWRRQDSHNLRQLEYERVLEIFGEFPVQLLCETMWIQGSSFYHWK